MLHRLSRQVGSAGLVAMAVLGAGAWAQGPEANSLQLWGILRNALTSDEAFFKLVKDAEIPPQGRFEGRVVSQPSARILVVDVDNRAGDATLKFDRPLAGVSPGKVFYFKGVVDSYVKEPFLLTLRVDDIEDVIGLTSK